MTDQRKKQIKDAIASMDSAARKKASKSSPGDPVIGKESVPTDAEMEAIFAANPDLATRAIEGASQAGAIAPAKHERSEDLTGETPKDKESDVPAEDRKHSLPTLGPQPKKLKR